MPPNDDNRIARLETAAREQARVNAALRDQLLHLEARLAWAEHERDLIRASSIWRFSAPLRRILNLTRLRRRAFTLAAQGLGPTAYESWIARHDVISTADEAAIRLHVTQLAARPLISVVMPVYNTPEPLLRAAIASVRAQLYPDWELCIADDASTTPSVSRVLAEQAAEDSRIHHLHRPVNGNICAATNTALTLATGSYVALMDHDDLLAPTALYEIAVELAAHPDADMIYSDEDQVDAEGRRSWPYFKPDWNIDQMVAHNLVSHLGVFRRAVVEAVGGMREGFEGSQDYDLALRVADATTPGRIRHVPRILYHWRQSARSFSQSQIERCVLAARRAIDDHLRRVGESDIARVEPSPRIPNWTRVRYALPTPAPLVSVIVPTRDRAELLRTCLAGILGQTDYPALEVLVVDNGSTDPDALALLASWRDDDRVRIIDYLGSFNFAAMNNRAAALARGSMLALVNNDIEVIEPGWLTEMVAQAARPGIGAVGARLLFPDGRVQHAGVVLGVGTFDGGAGVAGHAALHEEGISLGYFGGSVLAREVAAVTAACMVLTAAAWRAAGGMDETALPVAFNDVDLCLRLRRLGLRNIYTAQAELIHHESASRGDDLAEEHRARFARECRLMRQRWGAELDADPFYNPNFDRIDGNYRLLGPPLRKASWR